ncbi:hypothetical protein WDW89_14640 [Deltaproteobacteria bacterium TL4]
MFLGITDGRLRHDNVYADKLEGNDTPLMPGIVSKVIFFPDIQGSTNLRQAKVRLGLELLE